jgi:hypothetical protein
VKPFALLDATSAQAVAFDWLVAAVAPVSVFGQRAFEKLQPFRAGEERAAQERAENIAFVAAALDATALDAVRDMLRNLPDATGAIVQASMSEVLGDVSYLELQRFCEAIDRIDARLAGIRGITAISNVAVRAVAHTLAAGRSATDGFYLADAFDAELGAARRRLAQVQGELDASRGRAVERIAHTLGRDDVGGDEFIVMRSELHGSLPAGVRVVREAPTYLLCALEYDESTLAALARRDEVADGVAAAEERARAALSAVVREHATLLEEAARRLGELDVTLAAVDFTQRYHCTPAAVTVEPTLACSGGRFLPLALELEAAGRAFTPLNLELRDVAVLTGPNMGGKSVCLRTCGFIASCAAFGLPVPAARASIGLFDEIAWLGIGGDDELGGLLSSFAREVLRLKQILARRAPRLLVLVDEFARSTTPHEGKALVVALLEVLRERGARAMLATHFGGVAIQAGARHFAVHGLRGIPERPPTSDLQEALTTLAASMDYTIAEVGGDEAPRGDAIALTSLLGMDGDFVDAAYRALAQ